MSNLDFCGAPAPCAYAMFFSEISSCKAPGCGLQDAVRQNWKGLPNCFLGALAAKEF